MPSQITNHSEFIQAERYTVSDYTCYRRGCDGIGVCRRCGRWSIDFLKQTKSKPRKTLSTNRW